jgi:DNA-binding NarL/FixJ family response regulator
VVVGEDRLRGLVEAGIALSAELSLQAVLERLLEQGSALTGASRAAIGILGSAEGGFERTLGDAELLARPTEPSTGKQLLETRIVVREAPYATLVLADKRLGGDFAAEDKELVGLLGAQAAVAIENARRYESATRWLHQLEALTEVSNALARELELSRLLRLVAERLRELIGARLVLIELPTSEGDLEIRCAEGEGATGLIGLRLLRGGSKSGRVFERRRSERVDVLLEDVEAYQPVARRVNARAALYVPMIVQEQPIGMIIAVNKIGGDRFSDDDLRLAETFAARAAIAVDSTERVSRGSASRDETPPAPRPGGLTKRESEVLRLVALGLSDAEVAERLVVSPRTIHSHLRAIYRKLELGSRGAAARFAIEHRLV